MAVEFFTGPAHGTLTGVGPFAIAPGAGMTIDAANVRPGSGPYSIRSDGATTGRLLVKDLSSTSPQCVFCFAFRPDIAVGTLAESAIGRVYNTTAGTPTCEIRLNGSSTAGSSQLKLLITDGVTTGTATHTTPPNSGSWYVVEVVVDCTANPWTVSWRMKPHGGTWVDGPAPNTLALTAQTFRYAGIGYQTGLGASYRVNFQDWAYARAQTGYLDDHFVKGYSPNAAGTHVLEASPSTRWYEYDGLGGADTKLANGETASYTRIDDVPVTGTNDEIGLYPSSPSATEYAEFQIANTTDTPSAISVVETVAKWDNTAANNYTSKITDDGGTSLANVQTALDLNVVGEVVKTKVFATKPSGGAWTTTAFNALRYRFGFTTDANPGIALRALLVEAYLTSAATVPSAPQSLAAVAGDSEVDLGWLSPVSDGGSAVTGYKIYRGTASGGETLLASPVGTGTSYTDPTVLNGTTYFYKVSAVNAIGESVLSAEVSALPVSPSITRTFKRFYGPSQLGNTASTLYTCPASTTAVVRHIHVSNPTGAPVNFTLSIGTSAAGTRLWDATPVAAGDVLEHYQDHNLAAGEIIQGFASSSSALNLTIDGYEVTGSAGTPPAAAIYPSDTLFPSDTSP